MKTTTLCNNSDIICASLLFLKWNLCLTFDIQKGWDRLPIPHLFIWEQFLTYIYASLLLKYSPYGLDSNKTNPEDFIVHKDQCCTDI